MDYSKLSDFEINRAVAIAIGFHPDECDIAKRGTPSVGVEWNEDTGYATKTFDYCNNPVDAWPIIVGKKLSLINADDKWLCVPEDEPVDGVTGDAVHMIYAGDGVEHENPLRAAMIVFLMMQDSANVPANSTRSDIR
ncbi:phage protein NinX family protein [Citrobacter sp.]|uniref:phage protein NinX family protein n=1 Tax=Citrobacter sp. TaxID=1896336 RepID=UPI002900F68B|nr:phage protein NinX family protein [Citrobacter sp.]MDU2846207.1 phage protein NinX family protein [Citrobacter sp.]